MIYLVVLAFCFRKKALLKTKCKGKVKLNDWCEQTTSFSEICTSLYKAALFTILCDRLYGKKMTSEKIRPKLISYCRKALWRQRWPWASFTLICHCVPNFSQWIKPVIWGQLNTDSCGQAFSFGPHKLGVCELKHTPTYLLCTVTEVIGTICSARNTLKSHCWTQT